MRIKPAPFRIDPTDPFANDKLERRALVQPLTDLLRNSDRSTVLSIEAPWGWGKTTFLDMWKAELAKDSAPVISFNAWETDFTGNPLVSLIAELESGLEQLRPKSKCKKAVENLKNAGKKLLKRAIPVGVRLGTGGLVSLSDDVSDKVVQGVSELTEGIASDFVADYATAKGALHEFKSRLEEAADELRASSSDRFPLTVLVS